MSVLVLTHLDLTDLASRTYGIFQRLRVLLEASARYGTPLTIAFGRRLEQGQSSAEQALRACKSLKEVWGIHARVICIPFAEPPDSPWVLQQVMAATAYRWRPLMRSLLHEEALRQIAELVADADNVVVHRLPMMACLMRAARVQAPVYFDLDDIEYLTLARHARTHPSLRERWLIRLGLAGVYLEMWKAIRRASSTFVCSEVDRARLLRRSPSAQVRVVPNSVTLPVSPTVVPGVPRILMVGIYSFRPNADGADHFIEQAWPEIRRQVPNAELWLVGAEPEHLNSFARRPVGVRFLGFVQDLQAVYRDCRLVVCPIRSGGGTRIKLLEAAAHQRPIVSTSIGAEGIRFTNGRDILIADSSNDFAAACIAVLRDDNLAQVMGVSARELVQTYYSRPAVVDGLSILLREKACDGDN